MKLTLKASKAGLKSQSLKQLAARLTEALGYRVWRTQKTTRHQYVWGNGVDKLTQYKFFAENDVPALEYTQDREIVNGWVVDGHVVFGRQVLNASGGFGILEITSKNFQDCPVYTKYKKKKREFRVHCFDTTVVAIVEKKKRKEFDGVRNTKIRNLANGYVFCHDVEELPEGLHEFAGNVAKKFNTFFKGSSHFLGIDIGYNEAKQELFVIEVNSGPGIEGTNLDLYVKAILCKD